MFKPTFNALGACHRPARSEGQKENKEMGNMKERKLKKGLPLALPLALSIAVWSFFTYLLLILRDGTHDLPTVITGTLLGLTFACSVTWWNIGTYYGWKRMRVSKFKVAALIAFVAIFCWITVTCIEIWRVNNLLNALYRIAQDPHKSIGGVAISDIEERLQERLQLLTALLVSEGIVGCLLVLPSRIYRKRKMTSAVP